ncbi:hypothetical protein D9M68_1005540 [compost metagenome]
MVAVLGGHHGFCGLFTNLFQKGVRTFLQQASDVTLFGITAICWLAAFNHGGQARQGIGGRHGDHL